MDNYSDIFVPYQKTPCFILLLFRACSTLVKVLEPYYHWELSPRAQLSNRIVIPDQR